jgi:hypothetical protein
VDGCVANMVVGWRVGFGSRGSDLEVCFCLSKSGVWGLSLEIH